jgi:hypothetical protein
MSYALYIDDERSPKTERDWVVVRTYNAFVTTIEERGMPEHISFDHDLGEDEPTGYDCAKWLVEQGYVPQSYNVHSANPVGAENIRGLLDNWIRFNREND